MQELEPYIRVFSKVYRLYIAFEEAVYDAYLKLHLYGAQDLLPCPICYYSDRTENSFVQFALTDDTTQVVCQKHGKLAEGKKQSFVFPLFRLVLDHFVDIHQGAIKLSPFFGTELSSTNIDRYVVMAAKSLGTPAVLPKFHSAHKLIQRIEDCIAFSKYEDSDTVVYTDVQGTLNRLMELVGELVKVLEDGWREMDDALSKFTTGKPLP